MNKKGCNCFQAIFLLIIGLCAGAGIFGCIIESGIWWSRIRYDFWYWKNTSEYPYRVFIAVTLAWTLPVVVALCALLEQIASCTFKIFVNLFITAGFYATLGTGVAVGIAIFYTTPSKCKVIAEAVKPAADLPDFVKWIESQTKGMSTEDKDKWLQNLNTIRCTEPNLYMEIFAGLAVLSIIIMALQFIFTKCCHNKKHPELVNYDHLSGYETYTSINV